MCRSVLCYDVRQGVDVCTKLDCQASWLCQPAINLLDPSAGQAACIITRYNIAMAMACTSHTLALMVMQQQVQIQLCQPSPYAAAPLPSGACRELAPAAPFERLCLGTAPNAVPSATWLPEPAHAPGMPPAAPCPPAAPPPEPPAPRASAALLPSWLRSSAAPAAAFGAAVRDARTRVRGLRCTSA